MPSTFPDFLVFQIYGNLASWGDIAVGEHRPIQAYPSKSAIMGLLAASLGIQRDEDNIHKSMSHSYGMAVCVQSQGELLRDYHTTQVPSGNKNWSTRKDELSFDPIKLNTILSQRDYQMDAYYLIAIWQKEAETAPYPLSKLAEALQNPKFVTCLGRKSCPPCLPYYPQIYANHSLKTACENYTNLPSIFNRDLPKDDLISWYWEAGLSEDQIGMQHTMSYPRRDQIQSRKRWQFSKRDEYYYAEPRWGEC